MARIDPYEVVIYHNKCKQIRKTEDMMDNVKYVVEKLINIIGTPDCPSGITGCELPVKLISLPEAFCTGWPDSFGDYQSPEGKKKVYNTTIPGPETDLLGEAAKITGCYIMAIMQANDPEFGEDKFFNTGFIISPEGKVIHKRHKTSLFFRERIHVPTDVWDLYIQKYGTEAKALMDALYPVVKTDIGNLAVVVCGEGDKPEVFRALCLNGAEVVARSTVMSSLYEYFELQNRAHAHFNNMYIIGVNGPVVYSPETGEEISGCEQVGHVIDYKGNVLTKTKYGSLEPIAYTTIDVEQLRYTRFNSLFLGNYLPQLRMEQYIVPYQYAMDIGGLYPKNLAVDDPLLTNRPHDDILRWSINRIADLGIWTPPDGWEPYEIPPEATALIEKAQSRPEPQLPQPASRSEVAATDR